MADESKSTSGEAFWREVVDTYRAEMDSEHREAEREKAVRAWIAGLSSRRSSRGPEEQGRWTIYRRSGEWDDVIEGPDTEGGVEVVPASELDRECALADRLAEALDRLTSEGKGSALALGHADAVLAAYREARS